MAIKSGKRELIDTGSDKRFVKRREDGTFKESDDVGRSLAADRRSTSKTAAKPGYGDQGDQLKRAAKKGFKENKEKGRKEGGKKVDAHPMPTSVLPMLATKVGSPFGTEEMKKRIESWAMVA